jgi:uncharacterized repeat protein (TIGR03806 family)
LPGLVPYDVNAPLWSDDANKQRWLAIPDGTQIALDAAGHLTLPIGAMLLKTFELAGRRLETRVWMNHPDVGWRGYAYTWEPSGSDARLAPEGGEHIALGATAADWSVPGRGQCRQCHKAGDNQNLGVTLAQLDREQRDPRTGRSANQLTTWQTLGLLATPADAHTLTTHDRLVDYRDVAQPIALRARSYLHANCSSCHDSAAGYCTGDLRTGTPLAQTGVCAQAPRDWQPSWGWPESTRLLTPGDPVASAIWLRLSAPADAPMAMPPLGRHTVDANGVELIASWIDSLQRCTE